MSLTVTIKAMLEAGCSAEQLAQVVEAHEREAEELKKEKRAKRAAQKRVERERRLMSSNVAATSSDNVRHDATACDISSPSSPPLNGFPPNAHSRNIIPPFPIIPSSSPSPRLARGARLPSNWFPSMEDHSFADRLGVGSEVEAFRDYWHSQPGQKGVKLDWSATWRNWCRRAAQNKPKYSQRETPMQTGMRILEELENAKHKGSSASRDYLAIGLQRQPSGSGDVHPTGSGQLRGLLAIDPKITLSPKDWFDLEE